MESQRLQHDNTFRKILYENDQASSLGARNTQEECPSSQLPTPVPSGKKSSRFYQSEGRKKVVLVVFFFFDLCNNIRFARAVFPNSGPRSTEVGRGRGRASLSFRFWLGNGLEKAASSRGNAAEAGSCRRPLECTAQRDSDASDSINHNVFFIGILMGFSVVS